MIARILTSLVLVPLIILGIIYTNPFVVASITAGIMLLAAWEWTKLIRINSIFVRIAYLIIILIIFSTLYLHLLESPVTQVNLVILSIGVIWMLGALLTIISYAIKQSAVLTNRWINGFIGLLLIIPCWFALNTLNMQDKGHYYLIYLLFLIWAADTGAYFSGRFWGKKKLIAAVSPGKTRVGLWGGIILAEIISVIAYLLIHPNLSLMIWLLWALVAVIVSVVGDLFVSVMKRQSQIKDSGKLLPGHGGVLDRIDSLTTAAPFFVFVFMNLRM